MYVLTFNSGVFMFEQIVENWELFLTSIIALSALSCAFLPAPENESSFFYKIVYNLLNYMAFNVNKAENKQ